MRRLIPRELDRRAVGAGGNQREVDLVEPDARPHIERYRAVGADRAVLELAADDGRNAAFEHVVGTWRRRESDASRRRWSLHPRRSRRAPRARRRKRPSGGAWKLKRAESAVPVIPGPVPRSVTPCTRSTLVGVSISPIVPPAS